MISQQRIHRKNIFVFSLKNSSLKTMLVELTGYVNQRHFNVYVNYCMKVHSSTISIILHFQSDIVQNPEESSTQHSISQGLVSSDSSAAITVCLTPAAAQHHTDTHSPSPGGIKKWIGKVKVWEPNPWHQLMDCVKSAHLKWKMISKQFLQTLILRDNTSATGEFDWQIYLSASPCKYLSYILVFLSNTKYLHSINTWCSTSCH